MHLLASILALPTAAVSRAAAEWLVSTLGRIDRVLVGTFSLLGPLCWYVVIDASLGGRAGTDPGR